MNPHILTSELSADEVSRFIADEKIGKFAPVKCTQCGFTGPFERRVFRIEGKHRMDQDETRDLFRRHIWNEYGLQNVFFRTHDNVDYADVAICGKCGTTGVIFDIELDDGVFEDLSRRLGLTKEEIRTGMSVMRKILEKTGL